MKWMFLYLPQVTLKKYYVLPNGKIKNIKKTIALVDDTDYFELSESIGVDTLINKKLLAANEIFRFIRKGNILELNKLNNMNAEVLEF